MSVNYESLGGDVIGSATAAAGTGFYGLVPGYWKGMTRVSSFSYTTGNTAHNVTFMRPIGRTTLAADVVANTNTVTLAADPGVSGNLLAANDQLVICYRANTSDLIGTYSRHTVSAFNATTLVATLTPNTPAAGVSGSKVWNFGISSDTDPATGAAHPYITVAATTTSNPNFNGGGVSGHQYQDPILVYSANATGAGTLNYVEYGWTKQ